VLAQEENINLNEQKQFEAVFLPEKKEWIVFPSCLHFKQVDIFKSTLWLDFVFWDFTIDYGTL
jgi:hypothetical protein